MGKRAARLIVLAAAGTVLLAGGIWWLLRGKEDQILRAYHQEGVYRKLTVLYPPDGALFPPDGAAPGIRWADETPRVDLWLAAVPAADGISVSARCRRRQWRPNPEQWEEIKRRSRGRPARLLVLGVNSTRPFRVLSAGSVGFSTSQDPVGAPIFYREVIPPFIQAVKDPSRIVWRFGSIDSTRRPPVVLGDLPVCANCHSFSNDGRILGMDVDYGNDKGSYVIAEVRPTTVLGREAIISWSDYRKEDNEQTFGFLSSVSPDGRYVASTVKDRAISTPLPDLEFSLNFFPVKGILVVYDRRKRKFRSLPGADDPAFVQSNPVWSPDSKHVVFARARLHPLIDSLPKNDNLIITSERARRFLLSQRPYQYDLYRVPFNDGKGGKPLPLEGASRNGRSNYFPKYSPDGKWIVFCQARRFMLLQPDSKLFIIPAAGGAARALACNTPRMNSWHSWSPNSRWLVFASKVNRPYTQLFLTHIDARGRSSPPIVLDAFTAPDRAANIPEFVNVSPGAIREIRQQFVEYLRPDMVAEPPQRRPDADP